MKYIITDDGCFSYSYVADEMYLSTSSLDIDLLSDDELIAFISDCIIHELMHRTIYNIILKEYNKHVAHMVASLFESIEHHFIECHELDVRVTSLHKNVYTWKEMIDKNGIDFLFEHYFIDKNTYLANRDRLLGWRKKNE